MKSFKLSRRALLRGMGVAVGLPPLEAMLNAQGGFHGVAHAAGQPQRYVTWLWGCGVPEPRFWPQTGAGYAMTPSLAALEPVKADFTLVSGFYSHAQSGTNGARGSGAHDRGLVTILTGYPGNGQAATAPSIDWLMVPKLSVGTRIPLLAIGGEAPRGNTPQFNHLSYKAANERTTPDLQPVSIYNKIFADGLPPASDPQALARVIEEQRSVLDLVKRDIGRLKSRIGSTDKRHLDQHFEAIRALETRLANAGKGPRCEKGTMPTNLAPGEAKTRLLNDLMVMAIRCDVTRVGSYLMQNAGGGWDGLHPISHNDVPAHEARVRSILGLFAHFIQGLKQVPDPSGVGTLLDSTLVLATSEVPDGARHSGGNSLPVLLAGGGLAHGRHVKVGNRVSHTALLGWILNTVGVPTPQFGFDKMAPASGLF